MRTLTATLSATVLAIALQVSPAASQTWTPQQQEVWEFVKEWHEVILSEGNEGAQRYWHKDATFWPMRYATPLAGRAAADWMRFWGQRAKWIHYQLAEVGISVVGNVAICQYYLTAVVDSGEAKTEVAKVQAQVTLIRQDGKWLVLGIAANPYEME
jgi:hypothetical protein